MTEHITSGEVPSVGSPGTSYRGDRIYHNATEFHTDTDTVRTIFDSINRQRGATNPEEPGGEESSRISRAVFRGIVSQGVFNCLLNSSLEKNLEAGLSLHAYGDAGWLIYLAANDDDRRPLVPTEQIIRATSEYVVPKLDTDEVPVGTTVCDRIDYRDVDRLHSLWLPFGWQRDGVIERMVSIDQNTGQEPCKRDTWFAGLRQDEVLISAATAERITVPGANGPFDLIESTEWSTDQRFRRVGQSMISHVLRHMNQHILADLERLDNGSLPLIFAEANFTTRADKAGRRAGFVIPDRQYMPQVITQNVVVEDGVGPHARWRDFSFMVVPPSENVTTEHAR